MTALRDPDALARAVAADLAREALSLCPWCRTSPAEVHGHLECRNSACPYRGHVVVPCCEGTPRP